LSGVNTYTGDISIAKTDLIITSKSNHTLRNSITGDGQLYINNDSILTIDGKIELEGETSRVRIDANSLILGSESSISVEGYDVEVEDLVTLDIVSNEFENQSNKQNVISSLNGSYRVWVKSENEIKPDFRGVLQPDFIQYDYHNNDISTRIGDGFLYQYAPILDVDLENKTKVYDGAKGVDVSFDDFSDFGGELTGDSLANLEIDYEFKTPFAVFASAYVGEHEVSVSNLKLKTTDQYGGNVYGYKLSEENQAYFGSGEIMPRPLSNPFSGVSKVYDGTTKATVEISAVADASGDILELLLPEIINGDQIGLTYAGASFNSAHVSEATHTIIADLRLTGDLAYNYDLESRLTVDSNIVSKPIELSPLTGESGFIFGEFEKIYNGKTDVKKAFIDAEFLGLISSDNSVIDVDFSKILLIFADKKVGDTEILATNLFENIYDYMSVDATTTKSKKSDYKIVGPLDPTGGVLFERVKAKIKSAFTPPSISDLTSSSGNIRSEQAENLQNTSNSAVPLGGVEVSLQTQNQLITALAADVFPDAARPVQSASKLLNTSLNSGTSVSRISGSTAQVEAQEGSTEAVQLDATDDLGTGEAGIETEVAIAPVEDASAENDAENSESDKNIEGAPINAENLVATDSINGVQLTFTSDTSFETKIEVPVENDPQAAQSDLVIAKLSSGGELPSWIEFNEQNGTLSGQAPAEIPSIEIVISKTNQSGEVINIPVTINFESQ
ncbi:MAG TPA: hypothetical protein DCR48_08565, partial [Flavobacteriales bacterium]|nr:hypothetical protein [Flavobacteriales bacterium]